MTRERLVEIIEMAMEDTAGMGVAVECIMTALDKEREGEVTLGEGRLIDVQPHPCGPTYYACNENYSGNNGTLIFRPTNQEDKK